MMYKTPLNIAITCGGTGGHIFPGMATGKVLLKQGHAVSLWLAGRDIEEKTLDGWSGHIFRTGARQLGLAPARIAALIKSHRRSLNGLKEQQTDVLLAMGSYSSLPPVLAARRRRVPVVLHEANLVPGKAITGLKRFAKTVALSFAETSEYLPECPVAQCGLPVRNELATAAPMRGFRSGEGFTIFVTGGSQGAHYLNKVCSRTLAAIAAAKTNIRIIHQSGQNDRDMVATTYRDAGADALVFDFLEDMGGAFAAADLVVGRAGASTCAELALCGKPALLIPLPSAVRDHQTANAGMMQRAGAADICPQSEFTVDWLSNYIAQIQATPEKLMTMAAAARALAVPDAAEKLAKLVVDTAIKSK